MDMHTRYLPQGHVLTHMDMHTRYLPQHVAHGSAHCLKQLMSAQQHRSS